MDDASLDERNGSFNNSFADGLFAASIRHLPIKFCASVSSILKNAAGSFP